MRSVAWTVSSLRHISGPAIEPVNGHESFFNFECAPASCLASGEPWSTVSFEQRAIGRILYLLRSDWSLRWLMSTTVWMHQKKDSRSRFVKDVVSLLRRWSVFWSGQGSVHP